ncbi:TPA: hypothetical protein ACS772_003999, partial [Providencia alcalifaciens]
MVQIISIIADFEIEMTIKLPPKDIELSTIINNDNKEELVKLFKYHRVTDEQGRYHHWDDFQYRVEKGVNASYAWTIQKLARMSQIQSLPYKSKDGVDAKINIIPSMHKACSLIDQQTSKAAFDAMISNLDGVKYLISDLKEEESIS